MSLTGSVSLTNKSGVFLGSVNLDNLNISPNQVVYSSDGVNLEGLDLGEGLEKVLNEIKTTGNPDIQLTSNSIYVNDNIKSIQTALNEASQADVIYISSGSYGEAKITTTDKYNIALMAPPVGTVANTITEVLNGFSFSGTSELIRLANLQIKGINNFFDGVGRHKFSNCVFTGQSSQINNIRFGNGSTKFFTVIDCEFDNFCSITIPNTFASVIYFINCGFNGATITLNNASNLQVIFNNCAGFASYPSTLKATFIGLNVLANGQSQVNTYDLKTTLINGSAYPPSGVSISNQEVKLIPFCTSTNNSLDCDVDLNWNSTENFLGTGFGKADIAELTHLQYIITQDGADSRVNTNKVLTSDGVGGLKWEDNGGAYSTSTRHILSGQQTVKSNSFITLFSLDEPIYNKLPDASTIFDCVFNFSVTSNNTLLQILINDGLNTQSFNQTLSNNGHHNLAIKFNLPIDNRYDYNFGITASVSVGTISTDVNDYYNIEINQVKGVL